MEYLGYAINADDSYPTMKRVEAIGRGSVHKSLRGLYTSVRGAKQAIDLFENKKGEANG